MKRVLLFVFTGLLAFTASNAQYNTYSGNNIGTLKVSGGYTHDFPGLNGYMLLGEYSHSLSNKLEGAFAVKRMQLSGYPRTNEVNEYTKATTIDFAIYFLPLQDEVHILRMGIGYSFTFYNIRRSYPVVETTGTDKNTTWKPEDKKGKEKGFVLVGEYEYALPESNISLGVRAALYKAYDGVTYVGPFVAMRM